MNRYFDANATTPMLPEARDAWLEASERHWHNPSSLYRDAGLAAQRLEEARERLAELIGAEAGRIVFTSGATESNNLLFSAFIGQNVSISAVEHPSVREAARHFARVSELKVDEQGRCTSVVPEVALVSVQAANNESGVLQPWRELAQHCRKAGVLFHTDAAQWLGKLDSSDLGLCDYVTGSAHKFGGPKGCGFLVLKSEDETIRLLRGGPQEKGRRAGTENYPAVEAMVTALEFLTNKGPQMSAKPRNAFIAAMKASFPDLRVISEGAERLWNTVLMVMPAHSNLKWLTRLSRRGFSISTGSACSSGREGSSVVVSALGAGGDELKRVVRVSSGWWTTPADWQALASAFVETSAELDTESHDRERSMK